uniref:Uncharacterized protein n=1 Tax=Corethron hystrix TaxID=216773 RepID=A0A7S1G3U3_9STRA|mmetsp:Transcript_9587/g.21289  ORF Transcript_9587/g.21289 Transcript_9587/m.21289 type:complete len:203 (+) Transcript_9587:262-870(+)
MFSDSTDASRSRAHIEKAFSTTSEGFDYHLECSDSYDAVPPLVPLSQISYDSSESSSAWEDFVDENEHRFPARKNGYVDILHKRFSSHRLRRSGRRSIPLPCPAPTCIESEESAITDYHTQRQYDLATWAMYHRITESRRRGSHLQQESNYGESSYCAGNVWHRPYSNSFHNSEILQRDEVKMNAKDSYNRVHHEEDIFEMD